MRWVVVGGSIAGLAGALALQRLGLAATVLEKTDGRMADRGAGLGADEALLRATLPPAACAALPRVQLHGRAVHLRQPGGRIETLREPTRRAVTTWQHLHAALRDAVHEPPVTGQDVQRLEPERAGWRLALRDGASWPADAVVGADGHRSVLRAHVDAKARPGYAGYLLWRGMVAGSALEPALGRRFADGHLHLLAGADQHLVAYEVPAMHEGGSTRINWGWYVAAEEAARGALVQRAGGGDDTLAVPPARLAAADRAALLARAGTQLPAEWCDLVLQTAAADGLFANVVMEMVAARAERPPAVLVGDAAHLLSPITGSGARLALTGALALEDGQAAAGPGATAAQRHAALRSAMAPLLQRARAATADAREWARGSLGASWPPVVGAAA